MRRLLIVLGVLFVLGCDDNPGATRTLLDAGYTDIKTTGYKWYGCSKDDEFVTGFTAVGPTGRPVSGVVCRGWMKGATIRTF